VSLAERDKRALRLGVLLAAPILVFQFAVKPYGAHLSRRTDDLATQQGLLSRELQVLRQRSAYRAHHGQALRLLKETESQLFLSPDEVTASAALTHHVTEQARQAVVQVHQVQTLPVMSLSDDLVAVEVEIRGESDFEGVLTLLHGLEFGDKLITIPIIRIESVTQGKSDAAEPTVLTFTATVRGFSQPESSERSTRSRPANHPGG
jgi:hypothetical protein